MATDPRFLSESGREVFAGNELLVKGALEVEGGVHLMSGYPGSPVANFFDVLGDVKDILKKNGIRAFQANNEALGAAAVNGSQMAACRGIAVMKSVGVHVASDALALGNLAGAHPDGGAVIIMGDDPWCDSTQVAADSRFLCEHLRMAVVEPGTPQELKDWIDGSFKLSRAGGLYIGYIVTTVQADGGGTVDCRPNQFPTLNSNQKIALDTAQLDLDRVLLPPRTWQHELQIPERHAKTIAAARALGLNRIINASRTEGRRDKATDGRLKESEGRGIGAPGVGGEGTQGRTEGAREGGTKQQAAAQDDSAILAVLSSLVPDSQAPSAPAPLLSPLTVSSDSSSPADPTLGAAVPLPPGPSLAPSSSPPPHPIGFIVTGMAGPYLQHVLGDIGLSGVFPILRMGMSYPVDTALVAEFATLCQNMIVIEERRSFLEKNIRDGFFHLLPVPQAADLAGRLFGKIFPGGLKGIPELRGLNPSLLAQILIPLIKATEQIPAELRNGRLTAELSRIRAASKPKLQVFNEKVVARTPTFCPGCPHRDSSATLLELRQNLADPKYMLEKHGMPPVDLVAHGDTGCYTMLMFAPTQQLMHNYSGMGLGAGTGSGIDPFITNKQIVFMGDGTFFHSGQVAISNAVKNGQDLTFIILQNGTTAMTGHQEHPGTELDVVGNETWVQDIESIVRGMSGTSPLIVRRLSPADRGKYRKVLEDTILRDGVKVIIADKECGITHHRDVLRAERQTIKKRGYLPRKTHMNITPEVCENCLECTKQTACPGLTTIQTDYGRKIDTDLTWCVNDGACERVRTTNEIAHGVKPCPSFEQVTVIRQRRRRYTLPNLELDKLPEPARIHAMSNAGDTWRAHMAGVGGMGIGVINAILVRAGHKEGYHVIFADKKGLAIRNGGVYSQITFVKEGEEGRQKTEDRSQEPEARSQKEEGKTEDAAEEREARSQKPVARSQNGTDEEKNVESGEVAAAATSNTAYCLPPTAYCSSTGIIPYGKADLLMGIDILEAARAVDPREQFRVAATDRTAAVINTHKQPTVDSLLGTQDFDTDALREEILSHCRPDHAFAKNLSELCEQRLGSKLYANIMLLGVAFQLGLIPVSPHSIAWAIKDSVRREHRKNLKAFNIGRRLALEPRALPRKPEPLTWEQLVTNKVRILRKTRLFGRNMAINFERVVQGAMKQMRDLPESAKYDLALRIYDLMQYQDYDYAKRYFDLVRRVYRRDDKQHGYAATVAIIWNLARVMLIKDEPYVSYLLTRYEKKQRDIVKYGIDVSNGDRIAYKHHTRPEFNIGKRRIRIPITTRDWHLQIVKHMKWWRKLPGWHRHECDFREWYISLIDRVSLGNDADYEQALRAFKCPEQIAGYREIRYPKQQRVREAIEAELTPPVITEAEPPASMLDVLRTPSHV